MDFDEWKILDLYFKNHKYPFTNHHLDSYRELIKTYIPQTIKSYNPITMIKYDDLNNIIMKTDIYIGGKEGDEIFIDRPITFEEGSAKLLTPNDARLRNLTYESHIYTNVKIVITDVDNNIIERDFKNIAIGSIPIMLHSDLCILHGQGSEILKKLGECVYDTGGYFIIDGKEKVIIAQERITTNKLFVSKIKDDNTFSYKGLIRCTSEYGETMLSARSIEFYLVKNPDISTEDEVVEDYRRKKGAIVLSIPSVMGKIPLFVLFRALGIESDKDIYECIFGIDNNKVEDKFFQNFIRPTIANNEYNIFTQDDAINYLRQNVKYNTIQQVKGILTTDIFPNIPKFENKGKYLGYLVKQFINVCTGISKESDRDSYIYKRVDISGYLLTELFHESYMRLRKYIRDEMDKMYYFGSWNQKKEYYSFINENNIYKLIPNLLIAQTFAKSLKGMWGIVNEEDPELGKVQDLNRISYIGYMSHLRRVNMPLDRSIKLTGPHKLHSQQWGIMCPFSTPDGGSIGYLKELAYLTKITSGSSSENIIKCLSDIGVIAIEDFDYALNKNITKVFVNGNWVGITHDPIKITRTLRAYRRNSLINILISISWDIKNNEIVILTESGRPCRPLIILNNILNPSNKFDNKFKMGDNWFDMISGKTIELSVTEKSDDFYYRNIYTNPKTLSQFNDMSDDEILRKLESNAAVIEYLDIEEENTCLLSVDKKNMTTFHTHLEIHPSSMLSVVSGNIPLANHNAAARNIFHAAQTKQAIGVYASNFNNRFDTMGYVQHYPQKPIISTRISHYTSSDYMPNGFNVVVAIMTYTGFNQEDSIMINKKSIERGLFHLSYYKSITATAKEVSQNEKIIFANPNEYIKRGYTVKGIKHANYNYIDANGFIKEGVNIPKGQKVIVVGMINIKEVLKEVKKGVFTELVKEYVYTDVSLTTDNSIFGIVDKVFISNKTSGNNSSVCKVRFLKIKKPEFGDKHASRHGQKGVIGMIIPEENMPFTKDGIKPDIIINPHAIPSRMTIGHLVECIFSKVCCIKGVIGDGTVFLPLDDEKLYNSLEKEGFNKHGNEILYNGFNGRQIETEIFIGPTFYFRLKHMVAEKMNVRGYDRDKNELPKVLLTRQPTSGRRKGGGLRIGEMERDSILSHGISSFIKESMMERSDNYKWAVCERCGTQAIYNPKKRIYSCKLCNKEDLVVIETPYAFKLLTQELQAMNLELRFNTKKLDLISNHDIDEEEFIEDNHDTTDIKYTGGYDTNIFNKMQNDDMNIDNIAEENEENEENEDKEDNMAGGGEDDEEDYEEDSYYDEYEDMGGGEDGEEGEDGEDGDEVDGGNGGEDDDEVDEVDGGDGGEDDDDGEGDGDEEGDDDGDENMEGGFEEKIENRGIYNDDMRIININI